MGDDGCKFSMKRRDLLRMIGVTAGSAAMY